MKATKGITLQDYERAEADMRAIERRGGFYIHATVYVLVNILLIEFLWFFFPLIGWGIGLTMHFLLGCSGYRARSRTGRAESSIGRENCMYTYRKPLWSERKMK